MKDFIFSNGGETFRLEYKTDHLGSMDNFTVHDIVFSSDTLELDDIVRAGLNYERLPFTLAAFKAYAVANNYNLSSLDYNNSAATTLNSATDLDISTTTMKDGTPGVVDIQTLAIPATASATQGDYVNITNWNGENIAVWLDIDADGTAPTGALYVASDYQIKVPIVTGGTAVANAALFVAAINNDGNTVDGWTKYATVADAGSGNVTVTQTRAGDVDAALPKDDDDAGVGSITVTATQNGVDGVAEVQTITMPTTAGATQGDLIILTNYRGETVGVWIDIDANGTEPAGVLYSATDYQVMVPIVTGGLAAANGTLLYTALTGAGLVAWNAFVDIVDNEDGTVTITQKEEGIVDNPVPKNAAEDGVGSITAAVDTAGVDGSIYDEQIVVVGGNTPYVYALTPSGTTDLPAGLSFNTATGKLEGIATATKASAILDVTVTDVYGETTAQILTFNIVSQA